MEIYSHIQLSTIFPNERNVIEMAFFGVHSGGSRKRFKRARKEEKNGEKTRKKGGYQTAVRYHLIPERGAERPKLVPLKSAFLSVPPNRCTEDRTYHHGVILTIKIIKMTP